MGYSPWGHKESDLTERLTHTHTHTHTHTSSSLLNSVAPRGAGPRLVGGQGQGADSAFTVALGL